MAETREEKEETSVRRRVTIPKVDTTTLDWWEKQHDPGLSIRMLIRAEVERNGYTDVAFGKATQLPRRGRPSNDDVQDSGVSAPSAQAEPAAAADVVVTPDASSERTILVGPARSGRSVPRDDESPHSVNEPDPIASLMGLGA